MTVHYHGEQVRETTTSTGTGDFTLAGAVGGHQAFSAVVPDGQNFIYKILDADGLNWEKGEGRLTTAASGIVNRVTFLESSTGSVINLSAGTHTVLISAAAGQATGDMDHGNNVLRRPEIRDFYETVTAPVIASGVLTLNLDNGNVFDVSMTGNITSLVISRTGGVKTGTTVILRLTQDATGSRTFSPGTGFNRLGLGDVSVAPFANDVTNYALSTFDAGTSWIVALGNSGAVIPF